MSWSACSRMISLSVLWLTICDTMGIMTTTVTTRDGARYEFTPDFSSVSVNGDIRELLSPPSVDRGFRMLLSYRDGGHDMTEHVSEVTVAGDAPASGGLTFEDFRLLSRAAL